MNQNQNSEEDKCNHQKFKIIIVEDNDDLGELIQLTLQREGYSTVLAVTGEEALSEVQGEPNEILLVDYMLPDMLGKDLVQELIKRYSATPHFITLTGHGNQQIVAEMMKLGSHDYIIKEKKFIPVLSEVVKRVCADVQNRINLAEAKEQLRRNMELLKETGEMARVGGWEIDVNTNKVHWTETTNKIHEVTPDFTPDLSTAIDFFPGGARQKIEKAIKRAIKNGEDYNLELPFVSAKGNRLWVVAKGNPKMENGKCVRLHGTFQDITQRKQAELELKKKTAVLKRTEKIAHVGSWDWDIASDKVTWSEELFRIFKRDPQMGAVSYAEHPGIYTPESMKMLDEAVQKCMETGKPYKFDLEIIRGDGENAFCSVQGFAQKDENGKIIQLYGSFQDITERKKKEDNLRTANLQLIASEQQLMAGNQQLTALNQQLISSEQQLRAAIQQLEANEQQLRAANQQLTANEQQLQAANQQLKAHEKELIAAKEKIEISEERFRRAQEIGHIGSWEYDTQNNTFWGSDEGKRIYNLTQDIDEFSAREVMECVIAQDRERVNQAMIDLVNENKTYDIIFTITPKNTSERKIIRSIAELQKNEKGEPIKVLGVLHDITLQKTIEKELIVAKEKAEEADQLKSAFLANMSHEIRTPMNGILGFTNLLQEPDISGEEHQQFIDIIKKSGNRMLETVNALIDISKIETGQVEVSKERVDINKELMEHYSFFKPEASRKGLELSIENQLAENFSIIHTDKQKLNSIFSNLLKNAIKYTDEGFIKIGLERKDSHLQFYVKDSGIGVPKVRQKAIFNRFEQADIQDTRAFEGSGLGLAITKAYVELLEGEINVDSVEGKGSTFLVKLPVSDSGGVYETHEKGDAQSSDPEFKYLKVLIAEDDKISERHLSILLSKTSREILYSATGRETIELCKKHQDIDLILMDVKMPDINGYDATRKIREFNNKIIIIAQTAYALAGERDKALAAGCDEYISKPIESKKLFSLLENTLKKRDQISRIDELS